ncbi:MAG: hypothetical protein R2706_05315, partial [Acidimicrobiales bacterium]
GSTYLYQGEELGLAEVWDLPLDVLDDPVWEQSNHTAKGRDGCRVPLPWEESGPSYGFGPGPSWLPQPDWFGPASAAAQASSPDSTLNLYKAAIAARRANFVGDESLTWDQTPPGVIGFTRGSGARCWINLGLTPIQLPPAISVVLSSDRNDATDVLAPNATVWFR